MQLLLLFSCSLVTSGVWAVYIPAKLLTDLQTEMNSDYGGDATSYQVHGEEESTRIGKRNKNTLTSSGQHKRSWLRDPDSVWSKFTIVPYEIEDGILTQVQKDIIIRAFNEFEYRTCLRFIPKRPWDQYYLFLKNGTGCNSDLGRQTYYGRNVTEINLENGCFYDGGVTVQQEIMHAIGFIHEQSRPDRDQYVEILNNNIQTNQSHNFKQYSTSEVDDGGIGYDYNSLMHYYDTEWSIDEGGSIPLEDRRKTIIPRNSSVKLKTEAAIGFSRKDIRKINYHYNCR